MAADASIGHISEESISATLNEVTKLLDEAANDDSIFSAESMDDMNQMVLGLTHSAQRLESTINKIAQKKKEITALLHMANTRQMESLVERLQETLERETELRELENEKEQKLRELESKKRARRSLLANDDDDSSPVIEITSDTLGERLNTNVIMKRSELEMRKWVLTLIEEELDLYQKEIFSKAPQIDTSEKSITNNDSVCPSLTSIVQKVQQALNDNANDGIGKVDHAQGASVVHWFTSETYSPPLARSQTLGSVWWSQFIPQDWERLFPPGWEKCQITLPSYVYHSLGFLRGDVAPPEAILQKNTLPGSCWPMSGSSGQVVLKLAYPIVVDSVSIDHVSGDIIPEGKRNTAPKHVKIVGYPPCDETDEKCKTVGFDMDDPTEIADIKYNLEGRSVQTFESHYAKAMANVPEPSFDEEEAEPGSCSVKTSCSAPPRISVAAVVINVLENGGNSDFTCLYRVRLHGDPDDS